MQKASGTKMQATTAPLPGLPLISDNWQVFWSAWDCMWYLRDPKTNQTFRHPRFTSPTPMPTAVPQGAPMTASQVDYTTTAASSTVPAQAAAVPVPVQAAAVAVPVAAHRLDMEHAAGGAGQAHEVQDRMCGQWNQFGAARIYFLLL